MSVQLGSAYGKVTITDNVTPNIKAAQKSVEGFGKGFKSLSTGIVGGAALITGELVILKKAFDFGKEGAQLDYARDKFDALAESIGTTGDALMRDLKAATKGLVADSTLVASAGNLMALGLTKTHDEAVRLTKVAVALGMNMNQLVLTLTNQTTMRFDALGVSVDGFEEKVDKLKETGMDAQAAFSEAFLQQAEEQLALVGDVAESDAAAFMRFEASVQNLTDTVKTALYPTIGKAVEALNLLLTANQQIEDALASHSKEVAQSAKSYRDYISEVTRAAVVAKKITEEDRQRILVWSESGRSLDELALSMDMYEAGLVGLITMLELLSEAEWGEIKVKEAIDEAREISINALKMETGEVETATGAIDEYSQAVGRTLPKLDHLAGGIRRSVEAAQEAEPELKSFLDGVDRNIDSPIAAFIKDLEYLRAGGRVFEKKFEEIKKALDEGRITPAEAEQYTKELYIAIQDFQEELGHIDATEAANNISDTMGASVEDAKAWIDGTDSVQSALSAVSSKDWWINIYYKEHNRPTILGGAAEGEVELEPGLVPGGAHGLHGFIPPGYPNDSYLVAATSGERIDITPAGQGGGGGGGNQVINQHFYNAGAAALGLAYVETLRGRRLDASMGR